jgi:hypothetical protein
MVRGVKSLNHSQFIDDTLFLGGASQIIALRFKQVLDSFLDASGGEVNHWKCQILMWNARARVSQSISRIFELPITGNWSSFKYLGIPISLKRSASHDWVHILGKINAKFTHWGSQ